ncbi:MAG: DUF3179 domain-containing protein [Saprospiraceae bacterium]|nr:DUF3179 domain-containing protein [Saprospiraceae bacterium]
MTQTHFILLSLTIWAAGLLGQSTSPNVQDQFSALISADESVRQDALDHLEANWEPGHAPLLVELMRLLNDPWFEDNVIPLLEGQTGQRYGHDYYAWLQWLWSHDPVYPYYYADFKAELYSYIDPKFETYFFRRGGLADIRLDEVVWGGVVQDGIPPLRYPRMTAASEAAYLADTDVVFGAEINGDARAYPKRILAWHEMFVDQIGGRPIAGVYCTLCGTVIAYDMEHQGTIHNLGTSGFLYRSNKLMYDAATQSLWSTIEGRPVIGPLTGKGIVLDVHPVVTTTWGAWRQRHPHTKVLSLDTGHSRDYSEGAAYREYFSTDQLMFPVPRQDTRLNNKDEVLIVRAEGYRADPLAISIDYLRKQTVHQDRIGDVHLVVIADKDGAARAYHRDETSFRSFRNGVLKDTAGEVWEVHESHLVGPDGQRLIRLPAHNSFWFAWYNAYPETRLVK